MVVFTAYVSVETYTTKIDSLSYNEGHYTGLPPPPLITLEGILMVTYRMCSKTSTSTFATTL